MSSSKPFTTPVDGDDLVKEGNHTPPMDIHQNQNLVQQESQASIKSRNSQMVTGSSFIDEGIMFPDEDAPSASNYFAGNRPQSNFPNITKENEEENRPPAILVIGSVDESKFAMQKDENAPSASNYFAGNRPQSNHPDIKNENEEENRPPAILLPQDKKGNQDEREPLSSQAEKENQRVETEPAASLLAHSEANSSGPKKATEPEITSAASLQQSSINTETMEYKSHEKREQLHKDNLSQTGKKFHTYSSKIPVKVGKKEEVMVEVSVCPAVSDNNTQTAKLDVRVSVGKNSLKRLQNNHAKCGIMVKTEVLDDYTQQNIGSTQFHMHAVNMNDGKVTFRQDLGSCEAVNRCKSSSVTLVFKAIFVTTATQQQYTTSEHEEFEVIEVGD